MVLKTGQMYQTCREVFLFLNYPQKYRKPWRGKQATAQTHTDITHRRAFESLTDVLHAGAPLGSRIRPPTTKAENPSFGRSVETGKKVIPRKKPFMGNILNTQTHTRSSESKILAFLKAEGAPPV